MAKPLALSDHFSDDEPAFATDTSRERQVCALEALRP